MATTTLTSKATAGASPVVTKSKRVRTGCLTCRERHLKCDEAVPDCFNCRKSNRHCKRGLRLNFLDIQVYALRDPPSSQDWAVHFQDESRLIASEYQDGLKRYSKLRAPKPVERQTEPSMILRFPYETPHSRLRGVRDGADSVRLHDRVDDRVDYSITIRNAGAARLQAGEILYDCDIATLDHGVQLGESEMPLTAPPSSSRSATLYGFSQTEQRVLSTQEVTQRFCRMSDVSSTTSLAPEMANPPPSRQSTAAEKAAVDGAPSSPSQKPSTGEREFLGSIDEVHYMQVFVEEIAVWMDSFDRHKHFSEVIPYQALKSPMLLNAFLACGVKHISLSVPDQGEKALVYYNTATTQLLRSVQNPDRDVAECATAAVVLNVYEIMSDRPAQRMNHVAGARALIRDCGWNAKSTGIAAACFWLNIVMEVLSCLEMNWRTTWDPDQWGLDMDLAGSVDDAGDEQVWVHQIFYIVARIANFRASMPRFLEPIPHHEQIRLGNRLREWQELKQLCNDWHNACPRTMHPMGYLYPTQSRTIKSLFPKVWLIKRAAVLGRLFYHTALCILAQTHPTDPSSSSDDMRNLQLHHAHQVCGIVAHSEDRGIASAAIRALAIASPALVDPAEQAEALEVLERINKRSGWRLGDVETEVKRAWGWEGESAAETAYPGLSGHENHGVGSLLTEPRRPNETIMPAAVGPAMNPLSSADFSLPDHPYQNWYEPPNRASGFGESFF